MVLYEKCMDIFRCLITLTLSGSFGAICTAMIGRYSGMSLVDIETGMSIPIPIYCALVLGGIGGITSSYIVIMSLRINSLC